MNENNYIPVVDNPEELRCTLCGAEFIETTSVDHTFVYGSGDEATELTTKVPLRTCSACGAQFLDSEAEVLKHDAVCQHLGVLTPNQIQKLRTLHGLSRAEFARLTRLGEATLGRWERGALIQNTAYDQYLYLLGFNENIERLHARAGNAISKVPHGLSLRTETQLRVLVITEDVRRRASQFSLSGRRAIVCTR